MEMQNLFNIAVILSGALGGWLLKMIMDSIKELRSDVRQVEREMNSDFVRRDDFQRAVDEIKEILAKIFDRLENKANK